MSSAIAAARARQVLLTTSLLVAGCGGAHIAAQSAARSPAGRERAVPVASITAAVRASYTGPRTLRGRAVLRARVDGGTRIVAVTYELAGRAVGTVTRPPWSLAIDAPLLTPGTAKLRVTAVDRLGDRVLSPAVAVHVLRGGEHLVRVTTQHRFDVVLPTLARGHVRVLVGPGVYRADQITLGPGARLTGSGRRTVLTPAAGSTGAAVITTSARDVRVSDLALDGAGRTDYGMSISDGAAEVRVQRLRVGSVRGSGIELWGPHTDASIEDSVLVGRGATGAGVFDLGSGQSSDTSVIRTRISGFRGYGVLFAQRFYGLAKAANNNVALDNQISDIVDPSTHNGTDAGGIWSGGTEAAVIGNTISSTGTDGIETVGSSTRDTIVDNNVSLTRVGIYIERSTNDSLVTRNRIARVATGINVEWRHGGGSSLANTFELNSIAAARVGVFVDVQANDNQILKNVFTAAAETPVILQGSSGNTVRGNLACAVGSKPLVVLQTAQTETGATATSTDNQVSDNGRTGTCTPP